MVLKPKIEKRPGVYEIVNNINGHRYIGSSVDVCTRLYDHKSRLKRGVHENGYLQNAYNKYGKENFTVNVLLYCERDETTDREQEFLDKLNPEYNIAKNATMPTLGRSLSAETRAKISEVSKAMWQDEECRARIIKAMKGKPLSEEHKAKLSKSNKGIVRSEETKKKVSEAVKRRWEKLRNNPEAMAEWKTKQSEAHKGQKPSVETRAKMSVTLKAVAQREEQKAKRSENSKQMWQDEECRARIIKAMKGKEREFSEETKAKMSASAKARWQRKKETQNP